MFTNNNFTKGVLFVGVLPTKMQFDIFVVKILLGEVERGKGGTLCGINF